MSIYRLGLVSLLTNFTLMIVKIVTGIVGNSYALVADGIESAGDIITTTLTWLGFRLSLRPPDERHPYGHGKIESLTAILSGASLLAAALFISSNAIHEIRTPHHAPDWFTLPVLIAVVIVKEWTSRRILKAARGFNSQALEGDGWHHRSDAITSAAAAIGISIALIGGPGYESADDWAALLACGIILLNGANIIRGALHDILDGAVDPEFRQLIASTASEIPGIVNVEKCCLRKSGVGYFAEIHLEVAPEMSVASAHALAHQVKNHILASHPTVSDVFTHIEPAPASPHPSSPLHPRSITD